MMTMIRIGFTGSRYGMTPAQIRAVYQHALNANWARVPDTAFEGHHGDCVNADHEFHTLITALGWRTVAHPPLNQALRAGCRADAIMPPKPYKARDWDIAECTQQLIAAPKLFQVDPHSGTWITVAYAVQLLRPVSVYLPDGTLRPGDSFAFPAEMFLGRPA